MKFALYLFALMAISLVVVAGEITEDGTQGCQTFCPLIHSPICATDASGSTQTFSNECVMNSENCLKKTSFQKISVGNCP